MSTPFGQMIKPFFEAMKHQPLVSENQNSFSRNNVQYNVASTSQQQNEQPKDNNRSTNIHVLCSSSLIKLSRNVIEWSKRCFK